LNQFHNPEHERLAKTAVDPQRVLPGENLQSRDPEDVLHWIRVYEELAGFKEHMLADMEAELPELPAVAASEVRGLDITIIRQQLDRYLKRLDYWQRRLRELPAERQAVQRA
jgi:hypothetical protein